MEKIPALDGLRAVAIGAVLVHHTWGINAQSHLFDMLLPGPAGVRLFFVLSGFLITRILLDARAHAASQGRSRLAVLRAFYIRRSLRILPAAYAALVVAWLLQVATAGILLVWYATYLANFRDAALYGPEPLLAHFWSLAVEEQFYLLWPALILVVPLRSLPMILVVAIAGAAMIRTVLMVHLGQLAAYVMLPSRTDALAAGAVLAIVPPRRVVALGLMAAAALVLAVVGLHGHTPLTDTVAELGGIALSAALVVSAANGNRRPPVRVRPVLAIGRALSPSRCSHRDNRHGCRILAPLRASDQSPQTPGAIR